MYGFGLRAVILKNTGALIGQCGIAMQDCGTDGVFRQVPEIGYLFRRDCWHRGYAAEAALACRAYDFDVLSMEKVCSIIRNSSLAGALCMGMRQKGSFIEHD